MVAVSGRGWSLAPSLVALVKECDRRAPRRSTLSDGSIGDSAHRARKSDHNPSGEWVHGVDITHDPKDGMDIHAHLRNIAARHDGRVEYMISLGMIAERENGFRWVRYNGENPHNKHGHISVRHTTLARFDTSPWLGGVVSFPTPVPPQIYVPSTPKPTANPPAPPTEIVEDGPPIEEEEMKIYALNYPNRVEYWLTYADGWRTNLNAQNDLPTFFRMGMPVVNIVGEYDCNTFKNFTSERPYGQW